MGSARANLPPSTCIITKQPLGTRPPTLVVPSSPPALKAWIPATSWRTAERVTAALSLSGPYTRLTAVWNSTPADADSTPSWLWGPPAPRYFFTAGTDPASSNGVMPICTKVPLTVAPPWARNPGW